MFVFDKRFLWAAIAFGLAACDTTLGTQSAQAVARSAVNSTIEQQFPGVPITPITDCIIENASGSEIFEIAQDGADGAIGDETLSLILQISARPDTVQCFVEDAGPAVAVQLATML